ncbi:peptidylprolyl isomerase [Waterburya agarophytonicola K14]|uniref:peptidylprolyl isomerase n=1 Tax=Waterburya agarophytonicola KI4 TaxID=2874699 RepID=A0A964BND6_9CYAN|nr:peptidylprolyl isomerase [Waterburya agarophytonicola]MCC0176628.1 peptidylprolyl isomerase [Waterburya agarophytonicola KI4]
MTTIPLVTQPLDDVNVNENANNTTINLFQHFDDPFTTGRVARFELVDSSLGGGVTNVLLFDQEGAGAPATVNNFANYVEDGDYVNSIIHRSVPEFIVQGGGFTVNDLQVGDVPADEPVVNEFSADRSNLRGTIAMAKLGNDPNSATNQWFFNLADNSENLDNQNGGFTVFGQVLGEADLAPVDAIANLPFINATNVDPAFTNLPIIATDPDNPVVEGDNNLVRYSGISIAQQDELEFEVVNNSNPDLVGVSLEGGELTLDYAADLRGTADITIQATDLLGDSVEDTFSITVGNGGVVVDPDPSEDDLTVYRFLNNDTGAHLYTTSQIERNSILDLPNYDPEGASYVSIDSLTGNPEPTPVYRFLNENSGTHLYTISDIEKESVEKNLPHFSLESASFFAYQEQQPGTIPIYRFYNTDTGAHFYTPSQVERDSVRDNLPNYDSEGIAYYAFPIENVI